MRRIASLAMATGVVFTGGALMTSLTATPADAAVGFWRGVGMTGVDAVGIYNTSATKASLNFNLRDAKKDKYSAALHFTFTKKGKKNDVRTIALKGDKLYSQWFALTSKNTQHMYVQACVGTWKKSKFTLKKCASWRQHY